MFVSARPDRIGAKTPVSVDRRLRESRLTGRTFATAARYAMPTRSTSSDVTGGAKALRVAVAADTPTRELGLMCVTALRPQHGMIFVFHTGRPAAVLDEKHARSRSI